jgi:hypothetical protein
VTLGVWAFLSWSQSSIDMLPDLSSTKSRSLGIGVIAPSSTWHGSMASPVSSVSVSVSVSVEAVVAAVVSAVVALAAVSSVVAAVVLLLSTPVVVVVAALSLSPALPLALVVAPVGSPAPEVLVVAPWLALVIVESPALASPPPSSPPQLARAGRARAEISANGQVIAGAQHRSAR